MQHYNQGYDELYHYGKLGMKWGRRTGGEKTSIRQTLKERDAYIQKNRIERSKMKAEAHIAWKKAHDASNSDKYDEEKANKLWDEYETLSGGQKYRDLDKKASRMKTGEIAAIALYNVIALALIARGVAIRNKTNKMVYDTVSPYIKQY